MYAPVTVILLDNYLQLDHLGPKNTRIIRGSWIHFNITTLYN